MNRKKTKWTTKNTHIKKNNKVEKDVTPINLSLKISVWIVIFAAIISILLIASNNHIVGYDNFIGIPREWVHSLFD